MAVYCPLRNAMSLWLELTSACSLIRSVRFLSVPVPALVPGKGQGHVVRPHLQGYHARWPRDVAAAALQSASRRHARLLLL